MSDKLPSDTPRFPASPPEDVKYPHACLGLNACKGLGRTGDNDCAGQGYCSTTADHTCHVQNACKDQGGCGLYGTAEEFQRPGANDCQYQGSCATPINAERFSTTAPTAAEIKDGMENNRGKSVWARARAVFEERWELSPKAEGGIPVGDVGAPGTRPSHAKKKLGPAPAPFTNTGPTQFWIKQYSGNCMTACGASGMSGFGSCS